MYAIIKTGGKQYRVSEGDVITVEKIAANEGDVVTFDQVLTVVNDADVKVGTPVVEGAKITAKVEKQADGIFKYKGYVKDGAKKDSVAQEEVKEKAKNLDF